MPKNVYVCPVFNLVAEEHAMPICNQMFNFILCTLPSAWRTNRTDTQGAAGLQLLPYAVRLQSTSRIWLKINNGIHYCIRDCFRPLIVLLTLDTALLHDPRNEKAVVVRDRFRHTVD